MKALILATTNLGKIKEFISELRDLPFTITPQSEYNINPAVESGLSFIENAIIKARHVAQQTHLPTLADDSGLVVDALQGAPGIYSSRYAGETASDQDNIHKLLQNLKNIPLGKRQARFYCVIALLKTAHDPMPLICEASWEGEIALSPQGNSGFGYDPIFYIPECQCTAAQLSIETKNRMSHRGQSLKKLKIKLTKYILS